MRAAAVLAVLVGCYAPGAPTPGSPCDPAIGCPADQVCIAAAGGGHVCAAPGASEIDAPISPLDDAPVAVDAPVPSDGAAPAAFTYPAIVAECVNPNAPSTANCRSTNGNLQMVVDHRDSTTLQPWFAFVRFDLDDQIAGRTITSVTLRATTTDNNKAPSADTGEVWRVAPFTKASLTGTVPAHQDPDPLAGTRGAVGKLVPVDWPLPAELVTAGASVYLSIQSQTDDGVNYWNIDGATPPILVIDVQ